MKKQLIVRITIILIFLCPLISLAQIDTLPKRNDKAILIKSKIMPEERTIWVHLPPDYNTTTHTYPVLYLLDGDAHFSYVAELVDFLAGYDRDRTPDMIVVAITNANRGRDLTPIHPSKNTGADTTQVLTDKGAGLFLRYITDEVVPYVDQHYRAAPYRILAGHSLAGLFTLYAKETRPDLFPATILISPALGWANNYMTDRIGDLAKTPHPHNGKMFITMGNEDTRNVARLTAQLNKTMPAWYNWEYRKYDDENHFSVPYKSFVDALKFIYKDWFIDFYSHDKLTIADIIKHYEALSVEFGYAITPTEEFLNNCGYTQLNAGYTDNAIGIFGENVKRFPKSFNAYDSLGEAYMKAGKKELAIWNYKKSLELNPNSESGKEALKKLNGQ